MRAFGQLFEVIPDAVFTIDAAGRIVGANGHAARMFGYDEGELTGHPIEILVPQRFAARHVLHRARYALEPSARAMSEGRDLVGRRRDGSELPVEIMLGPLGTPDGAMTLCVVRDATERRRTEEALRASELRYRTLVEHATDGIFISSAEGRYLDVNRAGCDLLGYSRDEMLALQIADLVPADEIPRIVPEVARLRSGQSVKSDWRFRRKNGSVFFGEVNARQLADGRLLAVLRDVSARKAAEAALQKSEAMLAEAQELAKIGSWQLDLAGNVVAWSAQTHRIFEVEPGEFSGRYEDFLQLVHEDDRAHVGEAYSASVASRRPYEVEHRLVMKDGRVKHVVERGRTHYAADGTPLRSIGTTQDVTERRRIELALRASEARLAGVIESAFEAIITIDAEQRIVVFNRAAERMFGVPAADALGQAVDRFLPPRVLARHREFVQHYADHGAGARLAASIGMTGVRANGEEFPIEMSIARHGDGDQVLMTAMIRDVTERRLAEQALRAQQEAEAASRAKTEFLARMSHELRTPLNAVLGFAQLLQLQKDGMSGQQAKWVDNIIEGGRHLTGLINDLLDISRIEIGDLSVQNTAVDLQPLLDETLLMVAAQAERARVNLIAGYRDAEQVSVIGDPTRLRQVVLNVLSNAIKYNRAGGSAQVDIAQTPDSVRIDVSDTGLGMTAEQLTRLFVPFERLGREKSGIDGVGIGLALTRQVLTQMQGTVEAHSEPGRGTTMRVTLRRWQPEHVAMVVAAAS